MSDAQAAKEYSAWDAARHKCGGSGTVGEWYFHPDSHSTERVADDAQRATVAAGVERADRFLSTMTDASQRCNALLAMQMSETTTGDVAEAARATQQGCLDLDKGLQQLAPSMTDALSVCNRDEATLLTEDCRQLMRNSLLVRMRLQEELEPLCSAAFYVPTSAVGVTAFKAGTTVYNWLSGGGGQQPPKQ